MMRYPLILLGVRRAARVGGVIRGVQQFPGAQLREHGAPRREQLEPAQAQLAHSFILVVRTRLFKRRRHLRYKQIIIPQKRPKGVTVFGYGTGIK
jgi:hypothetical protein